MKIGGAYLTNPFSDITDLYLYDASGLPDNDPSGNHIQILYNSNYWLSYGGGISVGYKKVSCKGWVWEAFLGYHYWSNPNYFTSEFKDWILFAKVSSWFKTNLEYSLQSAPLDIIVILKIS